MAGISLHIAQIPELEACFAGDRGRRVSVQQEFDSECGLCYFSTPPSPRKPGSWCAIVSWGDVAPLRIEAAAHAGGQAILKVDKIPIAVVLREMMATTGETQAWAGDPDRLLSAYWASGGAVVHPLDRIQAVIAAARRSKLFVQRGYIRSTDSAGRREILHPVFELADRALGIAKGCVSEQEAIDIAVLSDVQERSATGAERHIAFGA